MPCARAPDARHAHACRALLHLPHPQAAAPDPRAVPQWACPPRVVPRHRRPIAPGLPTRAAPGAASGGSASTPVGQRLRLPRQGSGHVRRTAPRYDCKRTLWRVWHGHHVPLFPQVAPSPRPFPHDGAYTYKRTGTDMLRMRDDGAGVREVEPGSNFNFHARH